jgi:hypothetical protein
VGSAHGSASHPDDVRQGGFQVPNPLNRFAIGSYDKLTVNADGSLDLYLHAESPGADKESNLAGGAARRIPANHAALFAARVGARWLVVAAATKEDRLIVEIEEGEGK